MFAGKTIDVSNVEPVELTAGLDIDQPTRIRLRPVDQVVAIGSDDTVTYNSGATDGFRVAVNEVVEFVTDGNAVWAIGGTYPAEVTLLVWTE